MEWVLPSPSVLTLRKAGVAEAVEFVADGVDFAGGEEIGDGDVALGFELVDVGFGEGHFGSPGERGFRGKVGAGRRYLKSSDAV